jgi:AAA15 family ATPase/GTPase
MPFSLPTIQLVTQDIWVKHTFKDGSGKQKESELPLAFESAGTIKFMTIIGPLIDALSKSSTVVIDEMNVNFHSELCKWIVGLFQDPMENPKGAQLIFSTHDLELLDQDLVRRDQIWFVERDWGTGTSSIS